MIYPIQSNIVTFNKIIQKMSQSQFRNDEQLQTDKQPSTRNEILEQIFNQANPQSRFVSQNHIDNQIDSITKQIINGDIDIPSDKGTFGKNQEKNDFERMLKRRYVNHVESQKQKLEQRLSYLANSISSVEKDQYLTRKHSPLTESERISQIKQKERQWRKEHKQEVKKLTEKKKELEQKQKQRERQTEQIRKRIREEEEAKKKRQIMQNIKKIKSRLDNRQQSSKLQNSKVKELKSKKQLYQKMEDQYKEKEQSMLDERKKKLAEIRKLNQPINIQQILEHQQNIQELKKEKALLKERERRLNQSKLRSYKPSYESSYYKKVAENQQEEEETFQQKKERLKQFSDHVKAKFAPEVDEKKRKEFDDRMQKETQRERKRIERQKELLSMGKLKGHEYLQGVKQLPKKKQGECKQSPKTERVPYKNYLGQSIDIQKGQRTWTKILNSGGQKIETAFLLRYKSEALEQKLKLKEDYSRIMKLKDDGKIDQEYYEMVKAKLALLEK